jgi:4,5-dihydroxyphthalate decarboxylase
MEKLLLTLACGDYDRTKALQDGVVQPEGIRLNYIPLQAEEIFYRMCNHKEFDASEMSLSNYITMRSRGDRSFVAIPVFPSRFFRHSCVFINAEAGIEKAGDLKGKKIGLPEYAITAAVWIRGFLSDDFGVAAEDIHWFTGGQEQPGRKERLKLRLPPEIKVAAIPQDQTLNGLLDGGELHGLISARVPSCFAKGSPQVRRLYPDYREVEMDYYKRTKIFPIMHVLVIRSEIYEAHPWVAQSLAKAFSQAKEVCIQRMHTSNTLACTLPWLFSEIERLKSLFGPDWWPYGIEANRHTLETLMRYMREQGLMEAAMTAEELFPANVAGEYKL